MGEEMSITPDITRQTGDSCCSKCGRLLLVNDQAIVHEGMANGLPLVIGNCCADSFVGSMLQDFNDALTKHSPSHPSHWIRSTQTSRAERIILAAEGIAKAYRDLIYDPFTTGIQRIIDRNNHE